MRCFTSLCKLNGDLLAAGNQNGDILLYDINDEYYINLEKGHSPLVTDICKLSEEKFVSCGDDSIIIWSFTLKKLKMFEDNKSCFTGVCKITEEILCSFSKKDETVRIWNVNSGIINKIKTKISLAKIISIDERRIATTCRDGTI